MRSVCSADSWSKLPQPPGSGNRYLTGPPTPIDIARRMCIGRTVLAFLVALSLTMLPMARAFAVSADEPMASDVVIASADHLCDHESGVSEVVVVSSHDCCDHDVMPADHAIKGCSMSADCIAKCFSFYAALFSEEALPSAFGGTERHFASKPFYSRTASPPFRPPRA
jgi:hypothetical protein